MMTGNVFGDSHEPAPPAVVEAFLCNYVDGKDRDDLDAATGFYLKQAEKAGITAPPAYLWTRYKGSAPYELVWFNVHENVSAFGAHTDALAASEDMTAAGERFDTVVSCQADLGAVTTVFEREGAEDDDGVATIAAFGCNAKGPMGPAGWGDLANHIAAVQAGMGDKAANAVYQLVPTTPGPNAPDVVYFAVHNNAAAWAELVNYLNGTAEGRALGRHFNAVVDCGSGLWFGEQVVGGDEG